MEDDQCKVRLNMFALPSTSQPSLTNKRRERRFSLKFVLSWMKIFLSSASTSNFFLKSLLPEISLFL